MTRTRILVIEDLPTLSIAYAAHLEQAGYEPVVVETGAAALRALAENGDFSAVLLDLQLPDTNGLDLLRAQDWIAQRYPVIVATSDGSLSRAIEAMRIGAFDFLVKPVAGGRLISVVTSALETGRKPVAPVAPKAAPTAHAATPPHPPRQPGAFIGESPAMREVYRQIGCVARSRATVFITGESGSGKEVCAETIHRESGRAKGPFVAINCGAIPENLLESELFGHIKGSFTGAIADRIGAVQAAHKGTLFLDEICEMALPLQVKLLRFLQTGTVQRVGANAADEVDVRIVCATNRDPEHEVAAGRFREDLFYRLAVVPMHMPPLRDRGDDIAILAEAFLQRFAREEGKTFAPLGAAQRAALNAHTWPGNVRELQNVLRRAAVMHDGPELPALAFPPAAQFALGAIESSPTDRAPTIQGPAPAPSLAQAFRGLTLDAIERLAIEHAIDATNGSLPGAARLLDVSPSTLYRKRQRWTEIQAV